MLLLQAVGWLLVGRALPGWTTPVAVVVVTVKHFALFLPTDKRETNDIFEFNVSTFHLHMKKKKFTDCVQATYL